MRNAVRSSPTVKLHRPSSGVWSSRIDRTVASNELLLVSLASVELELLLELSEEDELDELLWELGDELLLLWLEASETLLAELALLRLDGLEEESELLDEVSLATVLLLLELGLLELLLEVSEATVELDELELSEDDELLLRLDSSDCEDGELELLLLVRLAMVEDEELLLEVSLATVLLELLRLDGLLDEDDEVSLATVEDEELFDDGELDDEELVSLATVELELLLEELDEVSLATVELEDELLLEELELEDSSSPPKLS